MTSYNKLKRYFLLVLITICTTHICTAATQQEYFPFDISYYKDASNRLNAEEIISKDFTKGNDLSILNFGIENATFWIKLTPKQNLSFSNQNLFLDQSRFIINNFYLRQGNRFILQKPNEIFSDYTYKKYQGVSYKLPDTILKDNTFYLRLKAQEAFISKVSVLSDTELLSRYSLKDIIFGLYSGIMTVMFFYNLFLFLVVRDRSYIYYIFYLLGSLKFLYKATKSKFYGKSAVL